MKSARAGDHFSAEECKHHFAKFSAEKYEKNPADMARLLVEIQEKELSTKKRKACRKLDWKLTTVEFMEAIQQMRDGAPAEDGVRITLFRAADARRKATVPELTQELFETPPLWIGTV